ncbi:hypothetical protein [Streptomyces sp. NPDC002790]|uniref:hypothetical protein n=1 Tax=Streptomyces sp. NPDC002790 TaxID=3154431 RepID=UPI0033254667
MTGRTALVIGGTGPTGPDVVRGLRERGFDTTVFHSGRHEVDDLPPEVRHLHGDPHFAETLAEALGGREFDVVVAQYGRLRHITQHFRHRTGHLVAIGGLMSPLARVEDTRWGPLGRPALVREEARHFRTDGEGDRLGLRVAEAARGLAAARAEGAFRATYIAYPTLYGPRQPGSPEWSIVRRLRDGRRHIVVPDGGRRLESRAFVRNVGLAPLLAVDRPETADGASYVVTDRETYEVRQRIEWIARYMGVDVELVDLPYDVATPAHPYYRGGQQHRVVLGERIRSDLGYEDRYDAASALQQTVDSLLSASDTDINEIEEQLGDPFDYAQEDQLIDWWRRTRDDGPRPAGQPFRYAHIYRHPTGPGESWRRPPAR